MEKPKTQPGGCLKSVGSAGWSEIPTSEGWWFDDESQSWENVASADLTTAIVEDWGGLWYGPIIIPEKSNTELRRAGHLSNNKQTGATHASPGVIGSGTYERGN